MLDESTITGIMLYRAYTRRAQELEADVERGHWGSREKLSAVLDAREEIADHNGLTREVLDEYHRRYSRPNYYRAQARPEQGITVSQDGAQALARMFS